MDLLAEARANAGLTQRDLAARLHRRAKSYVDRIESGDQIPDYLEIRDWAMACDLTPRQFHYRFEKRMQQTQPLVVPPNRGG